MQPMIATAGPLATADADGICQSQTPTAGNLTLNGALVTSGVAIMDNPRRVLITTGADESSRTFTIYGTNWSENTISETMTGPNNTTGQSVLDYKTVTRIAISGNAAAALTVGTSGVGGSQWVRFDGWSTGGAAIQLTVSGTVNYTLQQTMDDPNSMFTTIAPSAMTWVNSSDVSVVAATTTKQTNYLFPPMFARIQINSGTGTVTGTFIQSGVTNL
jgi:hypothetical protein